METVFQFLKDNNIILGILIAFAGLIVAIMSYRLAKNIHTEKKERIKKQIDRKKKIMYDIANDSASSIDSPFSILIHTKNYIKLKKLDKEIEELENQL